jgi:hypothetical protein
MVILPCKCWSGVVDEKLRKWKKDVICRQDLKLGRNWICRQKGENIRVKTILNKYFLKKMTKYQYRSGTLIINLKLKIAIMKEPLDIFFAVFKKIILLYWGVHCDIYKSSCSIS